MKQMIIGIYDGGYDYTINFLDIKDGKVKGNYYTRFHIENNKDISDELKVLGDIIYHYNYGETLKEHLKYYYKQQMDVIIVVEDGWVYIVN